MLRLMRGLVPVPEVLEVRRADPTAGLPALLITSFLPGARADELMPTLDEAAAGNRRHAARASCWPTSAASPCSGWARSSTVTCGSVSGTSATGCRRTSSSTRRSWRTGPPDDLAGLREVAETAQALLDTVGRYCLVHSDFNPKNLLLDPDTLTVTGLLDWEFAHAGHPYSDLGNLLRFDRHPAFEESVLAAYCARRGGTPADALELGRAADLWALVELATRRGQNPVADRAHELCLRSRRRGDPHAVPD